MIRNPLRRLSVRLTLWYSGMLLLGLALLGGGLYLLLARALHADLDQHLHAAGQATLALVELEHRELMWEGTEPGRVTPDALPAAGQPRDLVRLIEADSRVVSEPEVLRGLPVPTTAEGRSLPAGGRLSTARLGPAHLRIISVPVRKVGRFLGVLQVVSSLTPVERTLAYVAHLLWVGLLAALVFSVAIGQFLARRALDPVSEITRAARAIGAANLSRRLRLPDNGDELGDLAASFDEMLDRVEEAYRRQREFTADASHELRSPLAVIKGEASLARQPGAAPEAVLGALSVIEEEADRMTRLVEDLLLLARLDRGELLRADVVGLDELAHEVAVRYGRLASAQGLRLQVEAPDSVVVRGDERALRRVLVNLTHNALAHTERGEVCIRVSIEAAAARLEVTDTGCGIAPADQLRVFERFFRSDPARSRGGAGLGLALCSEIVLAHRGTVQLESTPGAGTRVTCRLPLATSRP